MTKAEKKQLARKFGSKTGKLKGKHILRAKLAARNQRYITEHNEDLVIPALTSEEVKTLLRGGADA